MDDVDYSAGELRRNLVDRMSIQKKLVAVVIAAGVCVTIAGCDYVSPSPTTAPTSSPTPTGGMAIQPTQVPVEPPTSDKDSVAAANKTIDADIRAFFDIFRRKIPADSLSAFETGTYLATTTRVINESGDQEDGGTAVGEPDRWIPDPEQTSVSSIVENGISYPYGLVQVSGCFQSLWTLEPALATKAPTQAPNIGQYFPYAVNVQYDPTRHIWLISDETSLNGDVGLEKCSLS